MRREEAGAFADMTLDRALPVSQFVGGGDLARLFTDQDELFGAFGGGGDAHCHHTTGGHPGHFFGGALKVDGRIVVAADDDHFFGAPDHKEPSIAQIAQIAGIEPAVAQERGGFRRLVEIFPQERWPRHPDAPHLPIGQRCAGVVANTEVCAGHRRATVTQGGDGLRAIRVNGNGKGALGQGPLVNGFIV